jgi:hypothetical protein
MKSHQFAGLLFGVLGVAGCGSDSQKTPDAPRPIDSSPDSPGPDAPAVVDTSWDEGGGTSLEYQIIYNAMNPASPNIQARVTAFYWASMTPARYPMPINPGCNKTGMATPTDDSDNIFPFGLGTGSPPEHTYLDVGTPIVTGGANQLIVPLGANPGVDGFARHHDGIWHFFVGAGMGDTYLNTNDSRYSLILTGSANWPAQIYEDAFYMAPAWNLDTPGFVPLQLVADTPFVQTYTNPNPTTNKPSDGVLSMSVAIIIPGIGPVVQCLDDNINDGSITVTADMVNYARSLGTGGVIARAHIMHRVKELTDGVNHTHKRMDFVTTWCYIAPFTTP